MRFTVVWFCCLVAPLVADDLELRLVPRWHGEAIHLPSAALANDHGQVLRVTRLAALISGVRLLRPDGGIVQLDGQYGFIDGAEQRLSFTLHNVLPGDYAGIEFQVGVPPEINHADPAHWPAEHPLNPLVNRLHWGWQGGFVFLALEGRWQSPDGSERGFSYHIATDAHLTRVGFLTSFKVEGPTVAEFALDLARVLGARELVGGGTSESTHSGTGDPVADELAAATGRAFFWLEARKTILPVASTGNPGPKRTDPAGTPWAFAVPPGFPQPELPADNPLTVETVSLGERLFQDPRLSGNGKQSCASCHSPARAFSDHVALSRGAEGKPGARNAMTLFNLAWAPAYAWDGGKARVRDQALAAMTNPLEMNAAPANVTAALGRDPEMGRGFAAAFGTPEVTAARIALALEQYLLTQVSGDSRFDRALQGKLTLSEEEKRGFALFATEYDPARGQRGADCFHCHGGSLFSDYAYKNNGIGLAASDAGRARVTGSAGDQGKFKTPSLRNVALTAPYMHDGRFATLEQVVAHYDHGVQRSNTLDPNLAKHPDRGLALSPQDQSDLVAFLRTLTDVRFEAPQP
jgi:cytochrome c peroxidase